MSEVSELDILGKNVGLYSTWESSHIVAILIHFNYQDSGPTH
jgi:hypothetical protein